MPYAGSVYTLPASYLAVSGETIEAQQHNDPLEDIAQTLNETRPIGVGGTGASTAVGGHDAFSTKGANVASATTTDIGAATGMYVHITGTTTITGFGTKTAGVKRICVFDGILTLTHNATSLILPTGANITTAAGDTAIMVSEGSGNWKCVAYQKASGALLVNSLSQPTLVLKQDSDPTPTAEGDIQWDTDDNVIVVGDGAGQKLFIAIPASTAAGDLLYLSGAKAAARLAKGTAGQALRMNSGATAPEWATPIFSKSFESSNQTITAAGSLTLAHSLGAQPKLYQAYLKCTTGEGGYSIGDEVAMNPAASDTGANRGVSLVPDATNINVRFGSAAGTFNFMRKDTGAAFTATNSSWALIVRAWV